jgi:hypothetical protein
MKNIFLLPTDKPSILYGLPGDYFATTSRPLLPISINRNLKNWNIYITSDEKIKDCWVLNTHFNEVYFCKGFYGIQPMIKKIVLTTDENLVNDNVQAIDNEFLGWFIKNPSCEYVDFIKLRKEKGYNFLGYEIIFPKEEWISPMRPFKVKEEPKQKDCCTPYGQIKRYKNCVGCDKKPKQETLEEAAERINYFVLNGRTPFNNGFKEGAKWKVKILEKDIQRIISNNDAQTATKEILNLFKICGNK